MSLISSSFFSFPSCVNQDKQCHFKFVRNIPLGLGFGRCEIPWKIHCSAKSMVNSFKNKPSTILKCTSKDFMSPDYESFSEENTINIDWGDHEGEVDDTGSPWEGAVVYKRNASISHVEYCTTLERLGLGKVSTDISKSRASIMGLRVTKAVKDYPLGTPVQISIDVTRKKHKLWLDGIIKTVITLGCNRCGEPSAECIFCDFTLILTEEPIEEPEIISMGVIFGEDKSRTMEQAEEDSDEASIDLDDWLHFPPEDKEIDISKHIRDMVHVEITYNGLCDPTCKGLCLKCGINLNTSECSCSKQEVKEKGFGPLGTLKEQMQQK